MLEQANIVTTGTEGLYPAAAAHRRIDWALVAEKLALAASVIGVPAAWIQGTEARDAAGVPLLSALDSHAVAWGLDGALIVGGDGRGGCAFVYRWLSEQYGINAIVWADNPERRHEEVIRLLRAAQALALHYAAGGNRMSRVAAQHRAEFSA